MTKRREYRWAGPSAGPRRATAPRMFPRKRVMIIDDHPLTRLGLAALINGQDDLMVCCEAGDPATAQQNLLACRADLVVADLAMPGRSGTEMIKDLRALDPTARILVLSMQDESFYGPRVLRAGARGYVMKSAGGDCVLAAIRKVLRGEVAVSAVLSGQIVGDLTDSPQRPSKSPVSRLTDREFELFRLIGQGKDTREIARQVHLSPRTVDVHRANIRKKLRLASSTALIHLAVRWVEAEAADRVENSP